LKHPFRNFAANYYLINAAMVKQLLFHSLITLLFIFASLTNTVAQSFIKGTVIDKKFREPLTGAAILVEGTSTGTTANIDGNFEIRIAPGRYNLIVSYVSYNTQKLQNIVVEAGKPTIVNIEMEEASLELQSVQVVATAKTDTDLSLLRNVRSALQVVSGISSQQIGRTLDRDASEVVKRIPGVTIQDNRFIVVRGLNQRYNNVWLNNAATPSSETDVKAFSFDAIPSNMIDNLLIYKTGAAENAAEATGGFIKITTKNIPDEDFLNVEYGIGYNDATTFGNALFLPGFSTDIFGLGHLSRSLPRNYPENLNDLSGSKRDAEALKITNRWVAQPTIALPNQKLSMAYGKKWNLDGGAKLGTITSLSYNTGYSTRDNMLNYMYERFDEINNTPVYNYKYIADVYTRDVRIGLMHNWALQLVEGTRIEFKNLFNQIGIDRTSNTEGWNNNRLSNFQYFSNQYSARTTYSGQLSGNHKIQNSDDHKLDWNAGFSYANRIEPDRQNRSNKEVTPGVFQYVIPDVPSINELGRLYMKNHEFVYTLAANWEKKQKIADYISTLKAGTYHELKTRNFSERSITYRNAFGNFRDSEINALNFETLFTEPYLGAGKVLRVDEQTNVANNYAAQNMLSAFYASFTLPVGALNINAGIRAEYNRLMLQGYYNASSPVNIDNPELDFFPAINASYSLNEKMLLRIAGSRSINRPEFREVAPLTYYDFTEKNSVVGNPDLKAATVYNLDFRYEFYPTPGETVTLAAFYKKFNNPIEMVSIGAGSLFSFDNAKGAINLGVELELKKSLAFLGLEKFSINMNASLINSMVEFTDKESERNRPLQGQSPYVFNLGAYYQDDKAGISSTLMYNVTGKRILVAAQLNQGVVEIPDIWEMPRNVIDFSFNKKLAHGLELKFGIKDILAQRHLTQQVYEVEKHGKTELVTLTNKSFLTGRTFSAGISWKIK
jgi:outer membrane receptor protein involved in Fe transport